MPAQENRAGPAENSGAAKAMVGSSVRKVFRRRARLHREIVRDRRFAPEDLVMIIEARADEFAQPGGWRTRAALRQERAR